MNILRTETDSHSHPPTHSEHWAGRAINYATFYCVFMLSLYASFSAYVMDMYLVSDEIDSLNSSSLHVDVEYNSTEVLHHKRPRFVNITV